MNKRKPIPHLLLSGLLLCAAMNSFAQEYSVNLLKNYTLPDINRKALELEFNSNGAFQGNKYEDSETVSSTQVAGKVGAAYSQYKNTRKFIGGQTFKFNFDGTYASEKPADVEAGYWTPSATYTHSNRFYKDKLLFWEVNPTASAKYRRDFGDDLSNTYSQSWTIGVPLAIGKGRIENVTDMRQAIYIAQALADKGVLTTRIADGKMTEFAQLISTVKNKRFLDYRKHLEEEITRVDSFLVSNEYVKDGGAAYFTTLYDYWLYGALFERRSGWEVSAGVTPGYMGFSNKNDDKYKGHGWTGDTEIKFLYENPVSLAWQHSAGVSVNAGLRKMKSKYNDYEQDIDTHSVGTSGSYAIGYYPNSRTNLNLRLSESFTWAKSTNQSNDRTYYDRISNTQLAFQTYYYISPQLRIGAEAALNYSTNNASNQRYDNWNGSYVAKITYAFY